MAFRRSGLLIGLLTLCLTGPLVAASAASAATAPTTTGFRFVDIAARDGAVLKANVVEPTTPGRHPAVVFISSWGLNDTEYLAEADALARRGYTVLSYTPRGFWGSGGRIEVAGPPDIADVSTVLDWLVAHTTADPARIGAAGVSYGAGIALIASAFDRRLRAVAATSTWTDLVESLYGGHTRRPQAVWLLDALAELTGRPSDELRTIIGAYFANRDLDAITAWGRLRSPATYVDAINANHPAIFLANAYGDSLFPPNQLVNFYNRLTGPKHLEFAPGDPGIVEATGHVGLPNHLFTSMGVWLDRYVAGAAVNAEPSVVLRRLGSDAVEGAPDWVHVTGSTRRYGLGAVRWWDGTGALATGTPPTGWTDDIRAGIDTTAGAGVALLSGGLTAVSGVPPTDWLPSVNRLNAGVWLGDPAPAVTQVRGIGALHLGIDTPQAQSTVVAYLYDVDGTGTGRLITHVPVTWLAPTHTLDTALPVTVYDIPAGHRLGLVVDTKDPLYLDADTFGARLTFTGPSWLDLPLK
jgi:hypothetical protein